MKKFVDDEMLLQMKITLIICQKKNTFTTRTIGGFISKKSGSNTLPLRKRSDFKQALERLHQEAGVEPFVPTYSCKHKQWQSASSSSSTWCNGKIPGGLLKTQKVKEEASKVLALAKTSEDNLFCYR